MPNKDYPRPEEAAMNLETKVNQLRNRDFHVIIDAASSDIKVIKWITGINLMLIVVLVSFCIAVIINQNETYHRTTEWREKLLKCILAENKAGSMCDELHNNVADAAAKSYKANK